MIYRDIYDDDRRLSDTPPDDDDGMLAEESENEAGELRQCLDDIEDLLGRAERAWFSGDNEAARDLLTSIKGCLP